jgi:hypothetical protein
MFARRPYYLSHSTSPIYLFKKKKIQFTIIKINHSNKNGSLLAGEGENRVEDNEIKAKF